MSPSRYSSSSSGLSSNFITNSRIRTDPSSHLRSRAVQVRLQLRYRETSDVCDLFVTALMQHLQREHQPLVFVERCERATNHLVQLLVEQAVDRRRFVI